MPDVPKPDMDKIRRVHSSLRRQRDITAHERFHRMAVVALLIVGFIGWVFFNHLKSLVYVAAIYFAVAVWRGNITFQGRRLGRRRRRRFKEDQVEDDEENEDQVVERP